MRAVSLFESLKIIGDHWTLRRRKTKAGSPSSLQWTLEPWWLQVWRIWIWWIFNRWREHSWVKRMLYPLTILRHIEMKRQASPGGRGTNDQMLSMFSVFALTTEQAITSILRHPRWCFILLHLYSMTISFMGRNQTPAWEPTRERWPVWRSVLDEVWMSKKDRAAMSCRTMVLCEVESFEVVPPKCQKNNMKNCTRSLFQRSLCDNCMWPVTQ